MVSCENMARRATIQRESVVNGNVVTDFYFPFTTSHTAYAVPEIANICQIYTYEQIDPRAILDVGISPEKAVDLFCSRINVIIRRHPQGLPVETRRLRLYASKFGSNLETVCAQLARQKQIKFKHRLTEPRPLTWKVVNVYSSKRVSIRAGQIVSGELANNRRVVNPGGGFLVSSHYSKEMR